MQVNFDDLRGCGLSKAKANYVKNVARFQLEFGLEGNKLFGMEDGELLNYLTQIKGVGRWTAEMILIFSANRSDVFPIDDLVIRHSMIALYGIALEGKLLDRELGGISNKWRPYRTLATRLLWAWKDGRKL